MRLLDSQDLILSIDPPHVTGGDYWLASASHSGLEGVGIGQFEHRAVLQALQSLKRQLTHRP